MESIPPVAGEHTLSMHSDMAWLYSCTLQLKNAHIIVLHEGIA